MNISPTTKGIMLGTLVFSAIGLAIGMFFVPDPLFFAIGVVIGAAMSVLKTFMLDRAVSRLLQAGPDDVKSAKNFVQLGYMSRYLLTGAVLVGAFLLLDLWGLVGTFVGTLAMTLAAVSARLFIKNEKGGEA
ncbi:MAG: ATP synthase subunit I [Defluviitaleaceae bacterium]|nr:ATP synthase subunit I [Defluviitaleaceae bacterium]